ncbi:MAG: 2-amino-4-hydroxy-6-hydroxymethyldihydropteridine diphosphokinase [bacterium]|jgi:2-amino-4-hydroxy-6-hydroxymethyldihydropteridine diphosphokinase
MYASLLTTVYVALGSNLGDRERHLSKACEDISELQASHDLVCSSAYETDPMGPQDQPDYLNAVCRFTYADTALHLLEELQSIERGHGRIKNTERWTARPLDLDILLFGSKVIDEPHLQIPHIGIGERSFVLWPLIELQPELEIPGLGSAKGLKAHCQQFGIKAYEPAAK